MYAFMGGEEDGNRVISATSQHRIHITKVEYFPSRPYLDINRTVLALISQPQATPWYHGYTATASKSQMCAVVGA